MDDYLIITVLCTIIILVTCNPLTSAADGPIVTIQQGQVQGTVRTTTKGIAYNAFLGIPYGKAPIRFAAPEPADSWTEVKDCTVNPEWCIQPSFDLNATVGVEDCLTLSVYTPNLTGTPLPVLIFVHGGAYFEGNIDEYHYGVQRFIDYADIVIVLMNYRLSAMGFVSTGDSVASGNYGLLDQNLALQWIQANIGSFNGDPALVTLSGESAGSASVVSHLISPKSAGLFQQLIAESGTVLNGWAIEEKPLRMAQLLGEKCSCPILNDTAQLIDCLRQTDASEIVVKSANLMVQELELGFVPVIDGQFITEDPLVTLQEGRFNQVPVIMGVNRDEGSLIYQFVEPLCRDINDNFFDKTMPVFVDTLTDYEINLINISYAIKDQYYNIDLNDSDAVTRANLDVLSDMFMISGSVQTINLITQYVPTWMYEFNYVGNWSWNYFTGAADCTHSIELAYLYNMSGVPPLNTDDSALSDTIVQLWADFVIQGDPTPVGSPYSWPRTPFGKTIYLSIDQPWTVIDGFEPSRMTFWSETVPAIAAA